MVIDPAAVAAFLAGFWGGVLLDRLALRPLVDLRYRRMRRAG